MPEVEPGFDRVMLIYLTQPDADYQIQGEMNYRMKRVPQLGLQYLSSVLAGQGVTAEFLDQALSPVRPSDVVRKWRTGRYGFAGFYTDSSLKKKVLAFIRQVLAEEPGIAIVAGGPGYPGFAEYHEAGVDLVCHGEGERTVVDIASIYRGERPRSDTPGISWAEDGRIRVGPPRHLIEDLDVLSFPDRNSTPIDSYYDWHFYGMRTPFVTAMAARGCPNRCTFCCSPTTGRRVRRRSVPNVLAEIDELTGKFGVQYVGYKDDIFVMDKAWLESFCDGLIGRGSPIRFSCNMHPFSFKTDANRFAPLMRRAGLDLAVFGIQSVNPGVLKKIGRHEQEPRYLAELGRQLKKQGVSLVYEFILGLPGDTERTTGESLDFALRTRPHYTMFYTLSVLEGSEIHREYGQDPVCDIPKSRQQELASRFAKKFFFNPIVILQNILHVLKKNPYWIWRNLKMIPYFIEATGIIKRRQPSGDSLEECHED
ncbi:B12-binding domain-containing radical SAM protein [Thermodesulfobacteriota bacterium]